SVELAIAGNIIDYGVKNSLNVEEELDKIICYEQTAIEKEGKKVFDYQDFRRCLKRAKTILYLGDNAGEVVFDRVLIEEIKKQDRRKEIFFAVRGAPIINDVLEEDAYFAGIDAGAVIINNGCAAPGTILNLCSNDFLKIYRKADMVISKGQGNFETLSRAKRGVFFLFKAKCPVVAKDIGCEVGDVCLFYSLSRKY
ncbi:MAG: DUF89 family protein, partial [Candidatus Omnitrophica bacterium]|nr:DUF89 family protein [Candidatus Omnitrophota bacterium]MBD3268597.1 DUF89 family protein [Candidatus Omnitrophota bacterium]